MVAGSEVGAIELDDYRIVEKGRLGPGQFFALDLERHQILHDAQIKTNLAAERPWKSWITSHELRASDTRQTTHDSRPLAPLQRALGYTNEDLKIVLRPMGADAQDAVWSMGDDTPVAPFARVPRPVYAFFRQRFAQVTNPPIDPLRESLVMSLRTWLGPQPDLLQVEGPQQELIQLPSPVIDESTLQRIRTHGGLKTVDLDATFAVDSGPEEMESAIVELCQAAQEAAGGGAQLLIISDRKLSPSRAPIAMLLALGAVHQHLLVSGLRTQVDLIVEAGDAWDVHHLAALVGYGAGAVCPWSALRSARALGEDDPRKDYPDAETAEHNYLNAAHKGLLKIMSKMGISTISSYRGGQIFECLGLDSSVVTRCFAGTPNRIGGLRFADLAQAVLDRHAAAFGEDPTRLPDYGLVRFRRDGERHAWEPAVIRAMHKAMANGQSEPWAEYNRLTAPEERPAALRDLLEILPAGEAVPLDEVEPWAEIVKRFVCTAMSLGALSTRRSQSA